MYNLLGICLALASLFAVDFFATAIVSLAWRAIRPLAAGWSARIQAEVLFTLRISAPLISLVTVGLLVVPAYIGYEPLGTSEVVSRKLAALATLSFFGFAFALWRAARTLIATKKLEHEWLRSAHKIVMPLATIPAFRMEHAFPIIAVVGTFRPRLFIAEQVLRSLTKEELAAAIAHECGHLAAGDNLKRVLLQACRDLLTIVPSGRSLDRAWSESVESAADEHAAQASPDVALNLASALVRIARMVPVGGRTELPLAAFLVGDETRGIKARVRRLLEIASASQSSRASNFTFSAIIPLVALVSTMLFAAWVAHAHLLLTVHSLVERAVSLLS